MDLENQVEEDIKRKPEKKEEKLSDLKKDRKTYPVHLEGKEYRLRFDLNAVEIIENEVGGLSENLSVAQMKIVIYAGLRVHHPKLTKEEVGAMIGFDEIEEISNEIEVALTDAMPKKAKKKVKKVKTGEK